MFREKLSRALPQALIVLMAIVIVISGIVGAFFIVESRPIVDNTLDNGNDNNNNGGNNMAAPSVPDDAPFKLPTRDELLPDGQVPIGYDSPTKGKPISTASELMAWLVDDGGLDAYLLQDINNFNWIDYGTNGAYVPTANTNTSTAYIKSGKTLDGCGKTITMTGNYTLNNGAGSRAAIFVYKIQGNLINTTFNFTGHFGIDVGPQNWGHRYGLISEEITGSGSVRNCKINVTGNIGIYASYGAWNSGSTWNLGVFGNFTGALSGQIHNSTVTLNNVTSSITMDSQNTLATAASGAAAYGGFAGLMNDGGLIKGCTFDYVKGSINTSSWRDAHAWKNVSGGAVALNGVNMGGDGGGGTGNIDGFIVKGITTTPTMNGAENRWGNITGYSNAPHDRFARLYTQGTNGTVGNSAGGNGSQPYYRINNTVNLMWDKTNNNIIINPTIDANKIIWQFAYVENGSYVEGIGNNCTIYDYELNQSISINALTPQWNGIAGNELRILYGEVGKVNSIPSKNVNYNGMAHSVTPSITDITGTTAWNNTNAYKVLYNNSASAPTVPSVAPYGVKIRSTADAITAKYAYLDEAARRFVRINDSFSSTITITPSDVEMTAQVFKNGSYVEYIDGQWTAQIIDVRVTMPNLSNSAIAAPNQVKISQDNGATWLETQDWSASGDKSVTKISRSSIDGTKFRFALFRNNVMVSNISIKGIYTQVDTVAPSISLHDRHTSAVAGSIGDLNSWKDSYDVNDDALSAAQVWIASVSGPSGLNVYARATKNGQPTRPDGSWGSLSAYHPTVDGVELTDVYKQSFYETKLARNNPIDARDNHRQYSGIYQIEFRAENNAGVAATGGVNGIIKVTVKIDYTDYKIDLKEYWNGQQALVELNGATDYAGSAVSQKKFKRTELVPFDINTTDNGNAESDPTRGYVIVSLAGVAASDPYKFKLNYQIDQSNSWAVDESGVSERSIAVNSYYKKAYFGKINSIENYIYGDTIPTSFSHTLEDADGMQFDITFNTLAMAGMDVGEYTVSATAQFAVSNLNEQYVGLIDSATLTIVQKALKIEYSNLTAPLKNYTDQWVVTSITTQIYGDDVVNVTRVKSVDDININKTGIYRVIAVIDNQNYYVDSTAELIVVPFVIDAHGNSLISTANEFSSMLDDDAYRSINFKLTNDIDYGNRAFSGNPGIYNGIIDGAGYKVSNILLTKTSDDNSYALFETLAGTIKNLTITNLSVLGISDIRALKIGGITANLAGGTISNVVVQMAVTARGMNNITVGGIAAMSSGNATISGSMAILDADIHTEGVVKLGGIIGDSRATQLSNNRSFAQAVVVGGASSAAHEIAVVSESTIMTGNSYLTKAISLNNKDIISTIAGNTVSTYNDFYASGKYGAVANVGGSMFRDVIKGTMPTHMFNNGADGTKANPFMVSSFADLLLMLKHRFASYKLTSNVTCFKGYTYVKYGSFSGDISYNGFSVFDASGSAINIL